MESQLKAPKILSKLELKTTSGLYVNGADGVHFLKLEDGNYQLIFGESKMYVDIKKLLIMHWNHYMNLKMKSMEMANLKAV